MMQREEEVRARVVRAALADLGVEYRWGGNDPETSGGLDCSGAALRWLRAGGIDLGGDMTADMIRLKLEAVDVPQVGDLAFYGDRDTRRATHVVLVLGPEGKAIIGANGGGPPMRSESPEKYSERMARQRASVRIEDFRQGGHKYRGDLLSCASLPVHLSKE